MLFKKQGFPEENELVLCTVTSVQYHSVFVALDEYGKNGLIHISEVSPGRIRNIRDFVKENKKIVCKVLKVSQEKGHIDLSLRRVNETEKRKKIDSIKREQNAEKILETVAKKLGLNSVEFYRQVIEKAFKKYETLSGTFDDIVNGNASLEQLGIQKKYADALEELVRQRIKIPEVTIVANLKLTTYAPNGVEVIKEALARAESLCNNCLKIRYLGSGTYRLTVTAPDYKGAEKMLARSSDAASEIIIKADGTSELIREE
ncbi:translation initiation factor IF-2 subunit alpha [Candidatus Woesearchaeota archaeon]|nr:translation initiation factor IF-2 subunit alpha [Candidatus Woesearchaeota archaeon]MBI2130410.1 translation initiation factor IF-2 subunit alpha [Candidatus Woesearchaeota archaeon]MBI2660898.1 translation initiation factor IF-2 subunit alpha [Candidatus Woesearchaeota archaeon]